MGRGRVDFERGLARLSSYARIHGHANPPASEVWLEWTVGLWVANLRQKFRDNRLSEDQITALEAIDVRLAPPYRDPSPQETKLTRAEKREQQLLRRLSLFSDYFATHDNINVKQHDGIKGWPAAGRWITYLRTQYRRNALPESVVDTAEEMGIVWNPGGGCRWT